MGKNAVVAVVGDKDPGITIDKDKYEKIINISFLKHLDKRDVSIQAFLKELKQLRLEPSEVAMDLLVIACVMYTADTRISRDRHGEDCWTRLTDLYIPVSDLSVWNAQKLMLEKIFRFLTGDIWSIIFRERADKDLLLSPRGRLQRYGMPYDTDTVCLFSGGMDSFIGAIDLLANGVRPLLISHSKSPDVSTYQDKCERALNFTFPAAPVKRMGAYIRVPKQKLFTDVESTERGRSFMFLTLGGIAASCLSSQSKLYIPENGLISLNIPLTPLRIGSHSTRTTHPYYLTLMQGLFSSIGLIVQIINPYQFKTKGKMLLECAHPKLVATTESMSCSHPSARWLGKGNIHCGYCVPCIIRQAAFLKASINDSMDYRENMFNKKGVKIGNAEGADLLAFKYMIEKVQNNAFYLTAAIRNAGPLGENVEAFVDVYNHGLKEVEQLIKMVNLI